MAKAAQCALCGKNVYVTEDGACPNGHSSEFLSNFYDVPDLETPAATEPASTPAPVAPSVPKPAVPTPSVPAAPVPPIPAPAPPSGGPAYGSPSVPTPPAYTPGAPMGAAPAKKSKKGLIIGIIVVVLLCCIGSGIGLVVGGVSLFEDAVDEISTSDGEIAVIPGTTSGTVRVELQWDEPVDMDLEIWDAAGEQALTSAGMENDDSFDGTQAGEYIDFKNLSEANLSSGRYVVSVYFAEGSGDIPSANVTLIVTKADGSTIERTGVVYWEIGMDQWHAFEIDATTGEITDINEFIDIEINE